MAIKGKSRSRGGARAGYGAPKPKIEPRKVPFHRSGWFRWGVVGLVALAVLIGVLVGLGQSARQDALEEYDTRLERATRASRAMIDGTAPPAMTTIPQEFLDGSKTADDLETSASNWEKEFSSARDAVMLLEPPEDLVAANEAIARGLDAYVSAARFFAEAADLQKVVDALEGDKALERRLRQRVVSLVTQGREAVARAETTYQSGRAAIDEVLVDAGVGGSAGDLGSFDPTGIPGP